MRVALAGRCIVVTAITKQAGKYPGLSEEIEIGGWRPLTQNRLCAGGRCSMRYLDRTLSW